MAIWIQVALGGALGALARYFLAGWFGNLSEGTFPIGVFAVNVLGCLLIGALSGWMLSQSGLAQYKHLLIVGFLGGFTTFSSFGLEAVILLRQKAWLYAFLYIGGTNLAGILAVFFALNQTERV